MAEGKSSSAWLTALRLQPRHAVVALAGVVGIVLTALIAYDLRREYVAETEAASSTTRNLTRVLGEHARQSLRRVELSMARAADEILRAGDLSRTDLAALRQRLGSHLPQDGLIGSFSIIDRDGAIVLSTRVEDVSALPSVADRDYFVAQRDRAGLGMAIGAAVKSRVDGRRVIPVSTRLAAPGGAFEGVLLAVVEPAFFQSFYDSIDTGANGFVTLFLRTGWIAVRSPSNDEILSRNWADSPMFRVHLPQSDAQTVRQLVMADGVERVYSYRALKEYPVIASLGLSLTDALAPWRAHAWRDAALLVVALAALVGATRVLTRQLRRRETAENALREGEARFRSLTELSSDWYWEEDSELRLTFMSQSLGEKTGIEAAAYLGQRRWDFPALNLTEADWDRHRAQLQRREPFRDFEMQRPAEDGRTIWLSLSGEPVFDVGGAFRGYRGVGYDITAHKLREALLNGEKQVLEMIARNDPLEQILTALMQILEAQAPGMLCSVLLLDAGGVHLRHGAAPSLPDGYTQAIDGIAIGEGVGSCGTAAFRRDPVFVEDIATDPLWADYRELALRHDLRACWSTPIFDSRRRVLGTFAVYYRQRGRPTAYHQWLIGIATHFAAIAVVRRETDAALRNAKLELEARVASRTEELAKALDVVTAANRAKSDFMANVTHELRTPLNSIIGFAELLQAQVPGPLNAKQTAFAADILAGGQRLLALVEGILEMSRLDDAGAALEREPVEIEAALGERVAAHRSAAEARRLSIALEVAADAGRAHLDPKALRRMLDALIDNAIKFNREGGAVAVSARRAGDSIEIAVADTGIGIAREDLAKLLKPLMQLDAGLARRRGGVGLGLALARRLAVLHGGSIEVESEPGKGSTFTLRLPIGEKS